MDTVEFERDNDELILIYHSDRNDPYEISQRLYSGKEWRIKGCLCVREELLKQSKDEFETDDLRFRVGTVGPEYTEIDINVTETEHTFYFANDITLSEKMFIATYNISILRKIDAIISADMYIGGNEKAYGYLPIEVFNQLILKFPRSAELKRYTNARIANIVKEYFVETETHEIAFEKFLKRRSYLVMTNIAHGNKLIELEQFKSLNEYLAQLLDEAEGIDEDTWQREIHDIIRLLYPKYILGSREIIIRGANGYNKRPDFLLIDADGYVDVMEIKKPSVQILTKQSSYRNNYVPVRELAGAIQQIEKYIYCLNCWGKDGEEYLEKRLKKDMPDGVTPKIINPQGILVIGRSNEFNLQQKNDFELIKRQYKHIADIMTYDNLLYRINNIISALEMTTSKK
ncbi:MAG TPA: Shedu immune nuclease family protein [Spirochaetia bacterium]|nr:Shedu immune nuclease family protein [Spirochaetia bacterium]